MQIPRALGLLCLGATTASVTGFRAWGGVRSASIQRLQSRGGGGWRWRGGGSGSGGCACSPNRLVSWPRCAVPEGGDSDNNYGSSDYSEYGYEPDHELQDKTQLEGWRTERLLVNDRWQFGMYGKQNVGKWLGRWQEYVAEELRAGDDPDSDEIGAMIGIVPGRDFVADTLISRRDLKFVEDTRVFEHAVERPEEVLASEFSCPNPVVETLFTDSFRGGNGTQVVGNTYTIAEARSPAAGTGLDDLGDVWVEVGLRARDVRVRCVFQYGRGIEGASVRRIFLVREGLERLPLGDGAVEPELYGSAGRGLYDIPSLSRSPLYFSIYAEGGLTLRFPLKVEAGHAGVFSVDWTAGDMRYQADRLFDTLDGSCRRLEVTEIGTEDSGIFLPAEKF